MNTPPTTCSGSRPSMVSALLLASLLLLAACGDDDAGFENFSGSSDTASFSDTGVWQAPDAGGDVTTSQPHDGFPSDTADVGPTDTFPPPPDPEEELDFDLRTPETGEGFLYIPSAGLDALVVVNATTLQISLVEVGVEPVLVRALPGNDGAVVLNAGTDDIAIVRPVVGAAPGASEFDVHYLDVLPDHNRLELSADGRWAFAWYDHRVGSTGGFGSLQDVSAIYLGDGAEAAEVFNLAIGFEPEDIHFTDDGRLVLWFCRNGISGAVLDLIDGDMFLPPVPVTDDPFAAPADREIAVTPNGRYAVVRDLASPALTLVDLEQHTRARLDLDDWPSDLDLTPDGSTAIVPMKATQRVALIGIPDAFLVAPTPPDPAADPALATSAALAANPHVTLTATGAPFGSSVLTDSGDRALLYTTGSDTFAVGMLDTNSGAVVAQPTLKPIQKVLVAPNGQMAALVHHYSPGATPQAQSTHAYTLLDLATGYPKLITTDAPIGEITFTDDSAELFALIPGGTADAHQVHRVSTSSFAVIPYDTTYAPIFVGAMPSVGKVAIALDNPTGWITFVDTETGRVDQVNSFELNGFIQ